VDANANCPFCAIGTDRIIASNGLTFTIRDAFPVSPGHTLVILKRHMVSFVEATPEEHTAILEAVGEVKAELDAELHPAGYNVGVNVGEAAGQTVMHVHVHVIPRFTGDAADPRGGVRHCIPGKGYYEP
jgi:diadenosine tetraphosphate (Ap4A) HIT family hydrolase